MLPLDLQSQALTSFLQLLVAAVVAGSVALLGFGVLVAVRCRSKATGGTVATGVSKFGSATVSAVMVALTLVQLVAWQLLVLSETHLRLDLAVLLLTALLGLVAYHILRPSYERLGSRQRSASMFLLSALQLVGAVACLQSFLQTPSVPAMPRPPGELVVESQWLAQTDSGQVIQLHKRLVSQDEFAKFISQTRATVNNMARHAMFRDAPECESNCHGWVFTGGKHIVQGEDVPTILSENQYARVTDPQVGDLVIYRNQQKAVVHTGVVSGFLNNQDVLIESKWGMDGTFVHQVDSQPYSQSFEFYRSPRPNHLLQVIPADAMALNFDMDD